MEPRLSHWFVPLVTALLGVLAVWAFSQFGPQPTQASVVPGSVIDQGDDFVEVDITWEVEWLAGTFHDTVVVPASEVDDGLVPVWLVDEEWTTVDPRYRPALGDYAVGAVVGALLGVVMVMTIRGYGYVRGDGEPGSKPYVPVGEEEGFYWRT